jgi:hypothetical protein
LRMISVMILLLMINQRLQKYSWLIDWLIWFWWKRFLDLRTVSCDWHWKSLSYFESQTVGKFEILTSWSTNGYPWSSMKKFAKFWTSNHWQILEFNVHLEMPTSYVNGHLPFVVRLWWT